MLITGVVEPHEGDLSTMARVRGVEPIVIPELCRPIHPLRDVVALGKLVRTFRRLRPDVVHTHTAKAGALGRVAARLARVPVVMHTFHGHVMEGYFSRGASRLFLQIERGLARVTDRIITLSPRLRETLLALGVGRPDAIEVIPLGLELERFLSAHPSRGRLRGALAIPPDTPLLGIVGRLVPIKDHPTLLHALTLLGSGSPPPHLVIVGDGEQRAQLQELTRRLNLAARVHFLGWRDDLHAVLGDLDVVICCSRNEGTPVALIEAMAAGVPVLSTDVGGVGDLIRHGQTGWLVPPGDPPALAQAIRTLLAQPDLRQRLAVAARPVVLAQHEAAGLVRRMEALYTSLMGTTQWQ
jgi:glycosyltransferase involved in cell wall biosynthesis